MGVITVTTRQLALGVRVPLDERTRIVVIPPAAVVTLVGPVFENGRSFPLPLALPELATAFEFLVRSPKGKVLAVSHTLATDDEPEPLSVERAEIIAAWLEAKPEPWLERFGKGIDELKRWGPREDRLMLSVALPESAVSPSIPGKPTPSRVEQFQRVHAAELEVDGILGPKTRTKLIKEYFALSRKAFGGDEVDPTKPAPFPFEVKPHGAGANFSLARVSEARAQAEAEARQAAAGDASDSATEAPENSAAEADVSESQADKDPPRIDLFVFHTDSGIEPAPAGASGPEYLEWIKLAERFRTLSVAAGSGTTRLALRLTDRSGRFVHARRKYELSGPEPLIGSTDADGVLEHFDVLPGDYRLKLTLEFFADPKKHDPADKIVDAYEAPVVVLASDAEPQQRMLGVVPHCQLARLKGLLFETNKAFLLPSAIDDLREIRAIYEQNSPGEVLVVGHTDTTADPATNDPLSLNRALATLAYLQDDVAEWEKFYNPSIPESHRWGEIEDEHMRAELTRNGIGGVAELDRKGLISAYMALDGADLDSADFKIKGTAHGCGEFFPLDDSGEQLDAAPANDKEDATDRRVELYFFERHFGIVPKPKGKNSKQGSKQYPAWRELADLTLESNAAPTHNLRLFLHDEHQQLMPNTPYRLVVGNDTRTGSSNAEGLVKEASLPGARKGVLSWGTLIEFKRPGPDSDFGKLRGTIQEPKFRLSRELVLIPDSKSNGDLAAARLSNLGYDKPDFDANWSQFQKDFGLDQKKFFDEETFKELERIHGTGFQAERAPPPAPSGPEPEPEDFEDDGDFANQMDIRLLTPDGDPVAGESFEVVDETGNVVHEGVLGDDGTATVVGLPPGSYTVDFPRLHGDSWESATV